MKKSRLIKTRIRNYNKAVKGILLLGSPLLLAFALAAVISSLSGNIENIFGVLGNKISAFLLQFFGAIFAPLLLLILLIIYVINVLSHEVIKDKRTWITSSLILIFISGITLTGMCDTKASEIKLAGWLGDYFGKVCILAFSRTGGKIICLSLLIAGTWLLLKSFLKNLAILSVFNWCADRFCEPSHATDLESQDDDISNGSHLLACALTSEEQNHNFVTGETKILHKTADFTTFQTIPSIDLLENSAPVEANYLNESGDAPQIASVIQRMLYDFNIKVNVGSFHAGPVVTTFELHPASGVRPEKIISLSSRLSMEIAQSMDISENQKYEIMPVRTFAGKTCVVVEVPNLKRMDFSLRSVLKDPANMRNRYYLPIVLGLDTFGAPVIESLDTFPHLLIGGSSGSGKSNSLHTMILSLLVSLTPERFRLVLIDMKSVEFQAYENLPHLIAPVATNLNEARNILERLVCEMDMRYRKFSQTDIRNIKEANKMPSIIIIVDEFTDLLRNKAESFIFALARKGRASGIHLILSTQHPCRDIVKSPLQANIPARISFRTARDIDSRVILGVKGAESLLGKGDMLFMGIDSPVPRRIHAPLVTANEIKNIVSWFR